MAIPLTAREPVEFTPPSLPEELKGPDPADDTKHRVRIIIRVPTPMQRDSYAAALVRAGVQHYTKQQVRDLMLAGVQDLFPEDEHERKQALLQELWAYNDDQEEQRDLEIDILREEQEKAKAAGKEIDLNAVKARAAEEIQPGVVMERSRLIEATAIAQEIVARFKPLNEVVGGLADQDAKRSWLNARMYVIGWKGLPDEPDPPGSGGLKQNELDYLRMHVGEKAFAEISDFITALHGIDKDEEKNLASLLANMSAPIGSSPDTSTESSENGNSTAGPSTTIPEEGSAKTTESSSRSSTSSKTRKAASKRGRTAGPS
jgi:hypothetical protein